MNATAKESPPCGCSDQGFPRRPPGTHTITGCVRGGNGFWRESRSRSKTLPFRKSRARNPRIRRCRDSITDVGINMLGFFIRAAVVALGLWLATVWVHGVSIDTPLTLIL